MDIGVGVGVAVAAGVAVSVGVVVAVGVGICVDVCVAAAVAVAASDTSEIPVFKIDVLSVFGRVTQPVKRALEHRIAASTNKKILVFFSLMRFFLPRRKGANRGASAHVHNRYIAAV